MESNQIQFSHSYYDKSNEEFSFRIDGTKHEVANSIVRGIKYVPSVGFDTHEMTIYANTLDNSKTHNDLLKERLNLIPLHFNRQEIEAPYQRNQYIFSLDKKNTTKDTILATTKDITVYDFEGNIVSDEMHRHIFPQNPNTQDYPLIGYLCPNPYDTQSGDQLSFQTTASLGIGKTHAMYDPAAAPAHSFVVDESRVPEDATINQRKRYAILDKHNEATAFHIRLESINGWKPWEIIERSITEMIKITEDLKNESISVVDNDAHRVRLNVSRREQGHLHVLRKIALMRERKSHEQGSSLPRVRYMGINIPHQTVEQALVECTVEDLDSSISDIHEIIDATVSYLKELRDKYTQFVQKLELN